MIGAAAALPFRTSKAPKSKQKKNIMNSVGNHRRAVVRIFNGDICIKGLTPEWSIAKLTVVIYSKARKYANTPQNALHETLVGAGLPSPYDLAGYPNNSGLYYKIPVSR